MTDTHPLAEVGLIAENFKCFGDTGSGFETFRAVNVIIGRNNSGKSALIDLLDLCVTKGKSLDPTRHLRADRPLRVLVSQRLDEQSRGTPRTDKTKCDEKQGEKGVGKHSFG